MLIKNQTLLLQLDESQASVLLDLLRAGVNALSRPPATPPATNPLDAFTPIDAIFKAKIMSKPTFYERVKDGRIEIYKMGSKSFIRTADYQNLFRKAEVAIGNIKKAV